MQLERIKHSLGLAAIYGILHALVDAATVTTTYAAAVRFHVPPETAVLLVLVYDVIAFASQPLLGWIADRGIPPRAVAGAGMTLCLAGGLLLPVGPFVAAVTAGIGNAMFHLGAGVVSMSIRPGRAAGPGIFVGPGTLGLAYGISQAGIATALPVPLAVALGVSLLIPIFLPHPETVSSKNFPLSDDARPLTAALGFGVVMLLLVSIFFRSLVGHSASRDCPKTHEVLFLIAAAGCLGKLCGGLISDKIGWIRTSVGALILAGPLIAFGGGTPAVIAVGAGLFQMTMPVTLVAANSVWTDRPAFVFGLNCLAFIAGALPVFLGWTPPFYAPTTFLAVTAAGVAAVWGGLTLLRQHTIMKY